MPTDDLIQALMLQDRGVISLIGAGGKTTLMFTLADRLARAGKKVLTTTTTKILKPLPDQSPKLIISQSPHDIISRSKTFFKNENHLTAGFDLLKPKGKILGFNPRVIRDLWKSALFDWIIVEADGADRKSLKVCAAHEPVVPDISTHVIALAGLLTIGKPLTDQWVFRAKNFSEITALPLGEPITENAMATALIHDLEKVKARKNGIVKIIFLNQADHPGLEQIGEHIARCLHRSASRNSLPFQQVVIGALTHFPIVRQWVDLPVNKVGNTDRPKL